MEAAQRAGSFQSGARDLKTVRTGRPRRQSGLKPQSQGWACSHLARFKTYPLCDSKPMPLSFGGHLVALLAPSQDPASD